LISADSTPNSTDSHQIGVYEPRTQSALGHRLVRITEEIQRTREAGKIRQPITSRKLMHWHGNPKCQSGETFRCNAALQIEAGSSDDLTVRASGEASFRVLYMICSL
jgi:hypothetical protein